MNDNTQIVERLVDTLPEGYANYLKVSLDPYHDKTIRFEGAPTSRNSSSICLVLNQEMTIAADDFPGITEPTWDAHFTMYPFINPVNCYLSDEHNYFIQPDATTTAIMRPLGVHGVNSGTPTYSGVTGSTLAPNMRGFDLSTLQNYITGNPTVDGPGRRMLRIVGESFEVIDESPEIYQQGAVTCYRYPLDVTPQNIMIQGTELAHSRWTIDGFTTASNVTIRQMLNCNSLKAPPINIASAVLIPGSETWRAREGSYVVGTQYENEVPFRTLDSTPVTFCGYAPQTTPNWGPLGYYSLTNTQATSQTYQAGDSITGTVLPELLVQNAVFPFNMSGAYFTGLSAQYAVLRLRYRAYVEVLTDPADNVLSPLSSPTLPFNQNLVEFCMKVIAKEPAGVPQTWNPAGEKWKKILHTIGSVAETIGPALDMVSPELSILVGSGGRLLKNATRQKKKKNNPQTQKVQVKPGPSSAPKTGPKPQAKR